MSFAAWRIRGGHLIAITCVVALAFCELVVQARLQAWQGDWDQARQAGSNLNRAVSSEIGRTIESLGLSLQAVVDNLHVPGVSELSPKLRNLVLFDRATTAPHVGVVLVVDEHGAVVLNSNLETPYRGSLADREYFAFHRDHPNGGLHVSAPFRGRLTQQWAIAVSRRLAYPDGRFAGLVMATVRLQSIRTLFEGMDVGPGGAMTLYRNDGVILMRTPYSDAQIGLDFSGGAAFQRAMLAPSGQYVATPTFDNTSRLFTYSQVTGTELRTSVAVAVADIEAAWWRQSLYIGAITLGLAGALLAAALRLKGELRKRQVAETLPVRASYPFACSPRTAAPTVPPLGPDGIRPMSPRGLAAHPRGGLRRPWSAIRAQEQIHPTTWTQVTATGARVQSGSDRITPHSAYRVRHADGAWVWISESHHPYRARSRRQASRTAWSRFRRDVTERKALEEQHRPAGQPSMD